MRYGRTGQGQATEKAAEGGSLCQGKQVWVWPCTWPPRCNTLWGETGFGRCYGNPQTVVRQVSLCSLGIPISAFNIAFVENHAQSTKPPPPEAHMQHPCPFSWPLLAFTQATTAQQGCAILWEAFTRQAGGPRLPGFGLVSLGWNPGSCILHRHPQTLSSTRH